MTTVQIELPDQLAREAKAAGLLTPAALEKLLREAMERREAVEELFATMDCIQAGNPPPMTEDEIQAEIDAARAERRARDSGRKQ